MFIPLIFCSPFLQCVWWSKWYLLLSFTRFDKKIWLICLLFALCCYLAEFYVHQLCDISLYSRVVRSEFSSYTTMKFWMTNWNELIVGKNISYSLYNSLLPFLFSFFSASFSLFLLIYSLFIFILHLFCILTNMYFRVRLAL